MKSGSFPRTQRKLVFQPALKTLSAEKPTVTSAAPQLLHLAMLLNESLRWESLDLLHLHKFVVWKLYLDISALFSMTSSSSEICQWNIKWSAVETKKSPQLIFFWTSQITCIPLVNNILNVSPFLLPCPEPSLTHSLMRETCFAMLVLYQMGERVYGF